MLAAFWQLIDVNAWDVGQGLTQEALVATSVLRLRAELFAWYRAEKQRRPAHLVHELRDLTPSMLGTRHCQVLHAKAAHNVTTPHVVVTLIRRMAHQLERGRALTNARNA